MPRFKALITADFASEKELKTALLEINVETKQLMLIPMCWRSIYAMLKHQEHKAKNYKDLSIYAMLKHLKHLV